MQKATCVIDGCEKPRKTRGMCGMHAERVRKHGDPHVRGSFIKGDDELRFWSKVDKRGDDECWRYQGTHTDGYGQLRIGSGRISAHRYSYERLVGPIPEGMQLDHVWARGCMHRDCVNPAHLEPVTLVENVMRGNAFSAVNARETRCIRGHEFDRVIVKPDGKVRRQCRTCLRMHAKRYAREARERRSA